MLVSGVVTLAEIQEQVASLPEKERAMLATFILENLSEPDYKVTDEEVAERARQMQNGDVRMLSMAELREGVFSDVGRR